jgi:hypothetical protein
MPTEDYSHMVIDNTYMDDGNGGDDDGDEEALKIPLSVVEIRILQSLKTKIMMPAVL